MACGDVESGPTDATASDAAPSYDASALTPDGSALDGGAADACVPLTCAAVTPNCGQHQDGCGQPLNCGACAMGAFANAGIVLKTPRFNVMVVSSVEYVYVLGGETADNVFVANIERAPILSDGSLGAFVNIGQLDQARSRAGVLIADNTLYAVGGAVSNGSGGAMSTASIVQATVNADGSLSSFTTSSVTLDAARRSAVATRVGSRLYVSGGYGTGNLATVAYASISGGGTLGSFTVATRTLTTARRAHAAVAAPDGSRLYVIGGIATNPTSGAESSVIGSGGGISSFAAAGALGVERSGFSTLVLDGRVYALGGYSGTAHLNTTEHAAITAGLATLQFQDGSPLKAVRSDFGIIGTPMRVYVIGGRDESGPIMTIEFAPLTAAN